MLQNLALWREPVDYNKLADDCNKWIEDYRNMLRIRDEVSSRIDHIDLEPNLDELRERSKKVKDRYDYFKKISVPIKTVQMDRMSNTPTWDEVLKELPNMRRMPELVPLRKDPQSHRHEFAHRATGNIPTRDQNRRLKLDDQTAVVLVYIEAGSFMMGANTEESFVRDNETPPHKATIAHPFLIGKFEITQGQWTQPDGFGGSPNISEYRRGEPIPEGVEPRRGIKDPFPPRHPVTNVKWLAASEWAARHNLRLPTEAEWEYIARAGTPWEDRYDISTIQNRGNVMDSSYLPFNFFPDSTSSVELIEELRTTEALDDGYRYHAPVGDEMYLPNAWGIHDMLGNVAEWCFDSWRQYTTEPCGNGSSDSTCLGDIQIENDQPGFRAIRGGSWATSYRRARPSRRGGSAQHPLEMSSLGFRVVMDIPLYPMGTNGTITPGAN